MVTSRGVARGGKGDNAIFIFIHFKLLPNCDAIGKLSAKGTTRIVWNQFSSEEHKSRYQRRNPFLTEVSVDTWKSTSALHMITGTKDHCIGNAEFNILILYIYVNEKLTGPPSTRPHAACALDTAGLDQAQDTRGRFSKHYFPLERTIW